MQLTTDAKHKKEISEIYTSVQNLKIGNKLPKIKLIDSNNQIFDLETSIKKPTVLYFWTTPAESHIAASHKKAKEYKTKYPNYDFIAININDADLKWKNALEKLNLNLGKELHAVDFEVIRKEWVITKVHRVIVLNADGTIKNGFANFFDVHFEENLK